MIYTGLTEVIGKPREYEKNLEECNYFERDHDLSIPLAETNEFRNKLEPFLPINDYNDQKTAPDAAILSQDQMNNAQ